jgi:ABC-type nitrate/sulfonate/bicarbonate transport system substrate-binding protein
VAAGVAPQDITYLSQAGIIAGLEGGDPTYGSLWAPNTYTYKAAQPDANVFCSGTDVALRIFGGLMVREEWANDNPNVVSRVLAGYLRGVTFMQNEDEVDAVLQVSADFYKYVNVTISEEDMKTDLYLRPLSNLDGQLQLMSRNAVNNNVSIFDTQYSAIEDFLLAQGVIESAPEPTAYITDDYMVLVSEDAELRAFAYLGAYTPSASGCSSLSTGMWAGLFFGVLGMAM